MASPIGDVTSHLLQQKVLKEQEREKQGVRGKPFKPSLNIASTAAPRQVTLSDSVGDCETRRPRPQVKPAAAEISSSSSLSRPQASNAQKDVVVAPHNVDGTHSNTHGGGEHRRYKITDTGSLHIFGKEDNEVLFSVKDEVSVHGTEHRERDKDKPKNYFHITEHKQNKRIEYKHLEIPEGLNGVLGQGSQGVVKKVFHRPTDTHFAMKILSTEGADSRQLVAELEHLSASLRQKHSQHLVTSYEAFFRTARLCILMELMEYGSLADVLKSTRLNECEARVLSLHVLQGLKVLQEWGVVHRDIKPGNLLINAKGVVKIADFGVATFTNSLNLANSANGTRIYMAPERMDLKQYSYQADVWSFGLCVAQAFCSDLLQWLNIGTDEKGNALPAVRRGPHSFSKARFFDCAVAIAGKCFQVVFPDSLQLSSVVQDFIHSCLRQEWEERPQASELLRHPFVAPLVEEQNSDVLTLESTLLRRIDTLKASNAAGTSPQLETSNLPQLPLKPSHSSTSLSSLPVTPTSGVSASIPVPSSSMVSCLPNSLPAADSAPVHLRSLPKLPSRASSAGNSRRRGSPA
eukprot:GGOE01007467.1.p1 GENE.GGOE01007467.1~~GGOE01007467.1.p1  ORF type:complete len:576 (-),score=125.84 GGOE01007467.1:679-2406(-)